MGMLVLSELTGTFEFRADSPIGVYEIQPSSKNMGRGCRACIVKLIPSFPGSQLRSLLNQPGYIPCPPSIKCIKNNLTPVYGEGILVGDSKKEYEVFHRRPREKTPFGEVHWEES
jgi:hypothetical protein